MRIKKSLAWLGTALLAVGMLGACGTKDEQADGKQEKQVLKVAALESGYGADMWKEVVKAYEAKNPDLTVELTLDKNIESVISPNMKAGKFPDVVMVAMSREEALPETLIKDNALEDLSPVLDMTVPGEDQKVSEKLIPGFTDTLATNPYGDGKTYLAPMFYSPNGLFFNAALLKEKGWEVPETWEQMWELGEKAKKEKISLFTYPVSGYFDSFFFALLAEIGGPDFYNQAMNYEEGIWETPEATEAFEIVAKLAEYTEPTTVANANKTDFTKNQQLILDNKALFMPNGTWITGEMAEAPRAAGFEWGFTALPAVEKGGDRYSFTFFEQIWMPAEAQNKEQGKEFIAYMYSDEAADIFAKANAIQPIQGISDKLEGENKLFYSVYDDGAKAVMGGFASTDAVEGVNMKDVLFGTIDSVVSGDKTVKQWQDAVQQASDQLRAAIK